MRESRILMALLFCLCGGFWACSAEKPYEDKILAYVNGEEITEAEFLPRYKAYIASSGIKDNFRIRNQILDNIINEYVIAHHIDTLVPTSNKQLATFLEYYRKKALVAAWKKIEIKDKVIVTDDELREGFLQFNTKLRARHLFAKDRQTADSLHRLLNNGVAFEALARNLFQDEKLALGGGDLGYFTAGEMDPAFEDAAFMMNVGDVSPPVQTGDGFSIIKVEDRKQVPIITETQFATKKKFLNRYLRGKKTQLAERTYINNMLADAGLAYDEVGLTVLWQMLKDAPREMTTSDTLFMEITDQVVADKGAQPCVKFGSDTWTVEQALEAFGQVKMKFLAKIQDKFSLKLALRGLVARELLYRKSKAGGYERLAETQQSLAAEARFAKSYFFKKQIYDEALDNIHKNDAEKYFEIYKKDFYFPAKVRVQMLVMEDSTKILQVKKQALGGTNFSRLVMQHSAFGENTLQNGLTDWLPKGHFEAAGDAVFALKEGEIAGPFKDGDMFWMVKMADRRETRQKTFAEASEEIFLILGRQKQLGAFKIAVKNLRKASDIRKERNMLAHVALASL